MNVAISAGHYPEKPGACYEDFCEYGEAIRWAHHINDYLIMKGASSLLVPTGHLKRKVEFINESRATLAVEIHFNSAMKDGKHVGRGSETLYYPGSEKGVIFANNIQEAIGGLYPPSRGVKEGYYRMNKNNGPDFFLARTRCPSVIIEPEFIHRKDLIQANRLEACHAIGDAIMKTRDEFT